MEQIRFFKTEQGRRVMRIPLFTQDILSRILTLYFRKLTNGQLEEGGLLIIEILKDFYNLDKSGPEVIEHSGTQQEN